MAFYQRHKEHVKDLKRGNNKSNFIIKQPCSVPSGKHYKGLLHNKKKEDKQIRCKKFIFTPKLKTIIR